MAAWGAWSSMPCRLWEMSFTPRFNTHKTYHGLYFAIPERRQEYWDICIRVHCCIGLHGKGTSNWGPKNGQLRSWNCVSKTSRSSLPRTVAFWGGDLAVNGPFSEYRTSPSSSSRYFSQTSPENRCFNAPGAVLQAEVGVHPCSPGIGEIGEKDTHDSTCFLSPFAHYLIIIIIYHHYPFISDGFVFALQNPFRWVSWWKVLDRIIRLSQSDHPKLCSIVQLCKTVKSWCEATNAQQREKVRSLEWSKSHG
jgi:hypothetical protein